MSTASCNVEVQIRYAIEADMANVAAVLTEASEWLCERGMPMWKGDGLLPQRITQDVVCGLFAVAEVTGEMVGTRERGQSRVLTQFKKSEKFGVWQDNCEWNTQGRFTM